MKQKKTTSSIKSEEDFKKEHISKLTEYVQLHCINH